MTVPIDPAASAPRPALALNDPSMLWTQLGHPHNLRDLLIVGVCLSVAWLLVRAWRGREPGNVASIWLGHHVVDGALFPVMALAFTFGASRWLAHDDPSVVMRVAVPMLLSLVVIRLTVKVLRFIFPDSTHVRVVERTVSWLAWLASILWILGVLPLVLHEMDQISWKFGTTEITLRNFLEGAISAVLVLILSLSLSSAIEARLLKGTGDNLSLRKIAANAIRALLLALGLMMALSAAGVDLTALSVLGGALGVGIGFGLQKLAANYVSGFVILAERSLRIGDLVRVDNFEGQVTDIKTRYTLLRAPNGRECIVPNELLITQRVENASLADRRMSLTVLVQVAYGSDVDRVMGELKSTIAQVPRVLSDPGPNVFLTNFAADGLELTISFWIDDPEKGQLSVRSEVNLAILAKLQQLGVEIPFPQRVLHQAAVPGVSSGPR